MPAAQGYTFHANISIVPLGQGGDEVVDFRVTACLMQYFGRDCLFNAEQNVLPDGSSKQGWLLRDE
jgi:hypothetical protein